MHGTDEALIDELVVASRALLGVAARSLADAHDVTIPQFRAMVLLAHEPRTTTELADGLSVHQSTATRLCDRLVRKGWVRREAVEDTGLLDESLIMYGEDVDWCWSMRQRGWRVRYVPSALVVHVGNASGRTRFDDDARTDAWVGNDLWLYPRWGRARWLYRWVRVAGAWRASRLAYDEGTAEHWRSVARAYLRRS